MKRIMIVGSGAREHAIATALHRSPQQPHILCFGVYHNPGIMQMAHHYCVGDINDPDAVLAKAKEWEANIVIIGPESPLEHGVVDVLSDAGISVIGPRKKLARIETSKSFARDLMKKYRVPGLPRYRSFTSMTDVEAFLKELGEHQYVVKANGLMGGKGVRVAGDHLHSFKEAMNYCEEILKGAQTFVIEEKLVGQEFSLMCFCDGKTAVPMPIVQDHKRAYVGDEGPNTGGMGSYTDANHSLPFLRDDDVKKARDINQQVFQALMKEVNESFIGILYGNFIITKNGLYVIEFNARFGDPEAMNVLSLLESDFAAICQAMVAGQLKAEDVKFGKLATVCKYVVPKGYPDEPLMGVPIDVAAVKNKAFLYLSAVNRVDGKLLAMGSRTAAYVGVAKSITEAEAISEREVRGIAGPLYHREDIGTERLIQKRMDEMRRLRGD